MASKLPVIKAHVLKTYKEQFAELATRKRLTESQLLRLIVYEFIENDKDSRKD